MSDRATEPGAGDARSTSDTARGTGGTAPADPERSGNPSTPRKRGSRGGRNRPKPAGEGEQDTTKPRPKARPPKTTPAGSADDDRQPDELPDRMIEGRPKSVEAAERALVRKPQIGDSIPPERLATKPAPTSSGQAKSTGTKPAAGGEGERTGNRRKRGGRGRGGGGSGGGGAKRSLPTPVEADTSGEAFDLDDETMEQRKGRERKGRPVGRYLMCVSVREQATHIAVLEGRSLVEHFVSRQSDDVSQIHGNIYLGRVQNVLPGMEAAFVDIGTPKNAVLYRGDVQYEPEDIEEKGEPKIEHLLKAKQSILCQVTKNPIAHKGARLTTEVSLPGRFVVMIPNSTTVGISKRLADDERKRLRKILDRLRPEGHGLIVRTAAEHITAEEIEADVRRLEQQWARIDELAKSTSAPALLYREPDMAVRVIREEFNKDYRGVIIDGPELYTEVRDYVSVISPALAERVQLFDRSTETLPLFERHHVHEQLHKALDRKVWLPSGGSLIIEHTEALTVIDVNTGKNVGSSSLEETVFKNNTEAAIEIARQLRLRDIGGIIVVDFIDMEIRENRDAVIRTFRDALARDKTRTQVFDISELGLVEMTRKRIGEGLIESYSHRCPECDGRGLTIDQVTLDDL